MRGLPPMFDTRDGYRLYRIGDAPRERVWRDAPPGQEHDLEFQSDATGWPVDHLGQPLIGGYGWPIGEAR